jgi:peptidoglycan hydrolase CwlO-like protein
MKVNINLLVILLAEIFALIVILWLIFHSGEYVTHTEFIGGTVTILGTMLAGYWSIWSRISKISEDVGELKLDVKYLKSDVRYLKSKTDKIELRMDKIEAKISKMEEDIAQIKSDVKYLNFLFK